MRWRVWSVIQGDLHLAFTDDDSFGDRLNDASALVKRRVRPAILRTCEYARYHVSMPPISESTFELLKSIASRPSVVRSIEELRRPPGVVAATTPTPMAITGAPRMSAELWEMVLTIARNRKSVVKPIEELTRYPLHR